MLMPLQSELHISFWASLSGLQRLRAAFSELSWVLIWERTLSVVTPHLGIICSTAVCLMPAIFSLLWLPRPLANWLLLLLIQLSSFLFFFKMPLSSFLLLLSLLHFPSRTCPDSFIFSPASHLLVAAIVPTATHGVILDYNNSSNASWILLFSCLDTAFTGVVCVWGGGC